MKIKKFQEGGSISPQNDPLMQMAQLAAQALQNQDCEMAMAVCEAFLQIIQQAQGGAPAYKRGGRVRRAQMGAKNREPLKDPNPHRMEQEQLGVGLFTLPDDIEERGTIGADYPFHFKDQEWYDPDYMIRYFPEEKAGYITNGYNTRAFEDNGQFFWSLSHKSPRGIDKAVNRYIQFKKMADSAPRSKK